MLLLKEVDGLSLLDICTNEQILHVIRSSDCAVHSCVGMGLCTKIQALKKKLCDEAFSNPEERDFRLIYQNTICLWYSREPSFSEFIVT